MSARSSIVRKCPVVATVVAFLALAATALAAGGDLSNSSCIKDAPSAAECGSFTEGLNGADGVAISPDGKSVYVAGFGDTSLVFFDRDPVTGALSNPGCIRDNVTGACGASAEGMLGIGDVVVSPDNKSVFVAGFTDDAVVRFDRDTTTGALSNPSCFKDVAAGECGASAEGLDGVTSLAVSPDGKSLYAVSQTDDAIARFDLNPTTGALSNPTCIKDNAAGECGSAAPGLSNPTGVAVSPDNKSVYVAGQDDDAIVEFDRDSFGVLSNPSCIKDQVAGECGSAAPGLNGVTSVVVSPDNGSVYAVSALDDAIVNFDRDPATGALSSPSCIQDAAPGECGAATEGLNFAQGLAVTPDGQSVYVASSLDSAIVNFDRDPATGALTSPRCIKDAAPGECSAAAQGLAGVLAFAISADGRSVYAAANADDAVVTFDRELPPPPPTPEPPAPDPGPGDPVAPDTTPPETTISDGPKKKEKKGKATFSFSGTDARAVAGFECSLDDGPFEPCSSPKEVKVRKGKHTFAVRARDAAGNVDATPAEQSWKVKKKKK